MGLFKQWQAYSAITHAGLIRPILKERLVLSTVSREEVKSCLRDHQLIAENEDVLVTKTGYVVMAIIPELACKSGSMLAVPGVDDQGQTGTLVFRENLPPFHSFDLTPNNAIAEASQAAIKSEQLIAEFGSKDEMINAVNKAPSFLMITEEDFNRSGLCYWGVKNTLSRLNLLGIAKAIGIPAFLVRAFTGPYGVRLIAAALLHDQENNQDESMNSSHQEG